jgi:hypothetical protein
MSITKKEGKYKTKYHAQVCVNGLRPGKSFDSLTEAIRWEEETKALLKGEELKERTTTTLLALQQIFDRLSKIERKVDNISNYITQTSEGARHDNH